MAAKFILAFIILAAIIAIIFLLGPRPKVDTTLKAVSLPNDLDVYLAEAESAFNDITPGVEKRILWASEPGDKSPISIVYLHGFSATHREIAPVCELVAQKLQANLFLSRLSGHGRGSEAMLDGSVNSWLNDANEALEIGRRIGDKVLLIGTSNGGSLATWLVAQQQRQDDLAGLVLISPNFGPSDKRSAILTWPWGGKIAEWAQGKTFEFEPKNELHARYWTNKYPTKTFPQMQAVVELARATDKKAITTPLLVIYAKRDRVVDPREIEKAFEKFGSNRKELVAFEGSSENGHHILAGDALSPQSNDAIASLIATFARENRDGPARTTALRPSEG